MSTPSPQELAAFEKQCDAWFAENTVRDPGFMLPLTFMEVSTDQQFDFLRDWQRKVYEAVLKAADAVFAIAKPGLAFRELHAEAMRVIAETVSEWGFISISAEESIKSENQHHRRWMVHGTSHHLGLDVHDCAQAKRDLYLDQVLAPGMVFTIEPGLYFQPDDLLVPEEFRGIGVRIEDNVLVTETGVENLSAALPRKPDEVEAWLAKNR